MLAAEQALQQKIPEENLAAYLFQIKALKDKLQSRFLAFPQVEEELEKIAETNEEQAKKLSERDESYIILPLDTQETLSKFDLLIKEIQDVIDAPAERSFHQEKQKQLLQLEITAEEEKRKHTRELEKEREAWMIQLDELKVKEEKAVSAEKTRIYGSNRKETISTRIGDSKRKS